MAASPRLALPLVLALAAAVSSACERSDAKGAAETAAAPVGPGAEEPDWLALDAGALLAALAERHPRTDPADWPALGAATEARMQARSAEEGALVLLAAGDTDAETAAGAALALADVYSAEGVEVYEPGAELAVFALATFPESARAWRVLGVNRARVGADEEALACLARAAELAPDDPVARREAALLRYERGELDAAKELFQATLAIDRTDRVARYGLARVYEDRGELELARVHLERLVDEGWEHPSPLYRLARVLDALGETEQAAAIRRRHERATILDDERLLAPGVPAVTQHIAVGAYYLDHGRPADALPEYEAALPLARGETEAAALAGLADACARLGRLEEGRRHLARLRAVDPHHPLIAYLAERLAP